MTGKARTTGSTGKTNQPATPTPGQSDKPGARTVLGRFTVRLYGADNVAAWTEVRAALASELGRIPAASEVAEVAARALLDSPEARARAVQLLRENVQ